MAEKNIGPNLEGKASDGNPIFTTRQWLERFRRQFTEREHKIDITRPLKAEDIWGVGPEALYQITREMTQKQNRTGQYKYERFDAVVHRTLFTKTQHTPQSRRLLLGQTI